MNRTRPASFARAAAAVLLALAGCTSSQSTRCGLANDVDAACGGRAWRARSVLAADLTVRRSGRPDLNGIMYYEARGSRVVLTFPAAAGGVASFGSDGNGLWTDSPHYVDFREWSTLLQWATWVGVPYRLTDPSLRVREVQPISVAGVTYRVGEVEYSGQGSGACALYVSERDLRPCGAVPVRPAGARGGGSPAMFAFAYEEFSNVDGVSVPTRWSVWCWDARQGVSDARPIASMTLKRPRFERVDPVLFEPPHDREAIQ